MLLRSLLIFLVAISNVPAWAATFVVNSAADASDLSPGDGTCDTGSDVTIGGFLVDECTLRAAIEEANAWAGADVAAFDPQMPTNSGAAVQVRPATALPQVTETLVIDGRTGPGYVPGTLPVISITGSSVAGATTPGLEFFGSSSSDSAVYALSIVAFPGDGLRVDRSDRFRIHSSSFGIVAGFFESGNDGDGIELEFANSALIGPDYDPCCGEDGFPNVIAASGEYGILIRGNDNVVVRNFIGTDRTGQTSVVGSNDYGNTFYGVFVESGSRNRIGAVSADLEGDGFPRGNVISGNGITGLVIAAPALDTVVLANHVGTDVDGDTALPNGAAGIEVGGDRAWIGSPGPGSNLVSGNVGLGIRVDRVDGESEPQDVRVEGNRVGLDAAAGAPLANGTSGIFVDEAIRTVVIGNVIGGNPGAGIGVAGTGSVVRSNLVGTNESGADLGNGFAGISCSGAVAEIGGPSPLDGNTVGFNLGFGIRGDGCDNGSIENNRIGTNGGGTNLSQPGGIDVATSFGVSIRANVVGFSTTGIRLDQSDDAVVQSNWLGIDPAGYDIGNSAAGISIENSSGAKVGLSRLDSEPQAVANTIANNGTVGVQVIDPEGDDLESTLRGNAIYDNTHQAISLTGLSGTANDPGDADIGANNLQNFPELDAAGTFYDGNANTITARYRVDTDVANAVYPLVVDFYTEGGRDWVGQDIYYRSVAGLYRSVEFELPATVPVPGATLRATATDASGFGNTSELSGPVALPEPSATAVIVSGSVFLVALWSRRERRMRP